jgi:hypothetical protein
LEVNGKPLLLVPPSLVRLSDTNIHDTEWAQQYEYLIWTIEVIRDHMNENSCTYRLADVEMALFMMGI